MASEVVAAVAAGVAFAAAAVAVVAAVAAAGPSRQAASHLAVASCSGERWAAFRVVLPPRPPPPPPPTGASRGTRGSASWDQSSPAAPSSACSAPSASRREPRASCRAASAAARRTDVQDTFRDASRDAFPSAPPALLQEADSEARPLACRRALFPCGQASSVQPDPYPSVASVGAAAAVAETTAEAREGCWVL